MKLTVMCVCAGRRTHRRIKIQHKVYWSKQAVV